MDVMPKQMRHAIGQRQAQTESAFRVVRVPAAVEFVENRFDLIRGDAGAGVQYLDLQVIAAMATAQCDATRCRVAHGIGQKVLYDATQQCRIAMYPAAAGHVIEAQATFVREYAKFCRQWCEDLVDGERPGTRIPAAGVDLGNVQQWVE